MASKRPPYAPILCYLYLFAFSLLYCIYDLFLINFLLSHSEIQESIWLRRIYPFLFKFFLFMCLWSLLTTVTNDLKIPNKKFKLSPDYLALYNSTEDSLERNRVLLEYTVQTQLDVCPVQKVFEPGNDPLPCLNFCTPCQAIQPNRAEHCKMCECCVLLEDHHCSTVGLCINLGNLKPFLCFVAHFALLSLTIVFTIAPHIGTVWSDPRSRSYTYIAQAALTTALLGYSLMWTLWVGGLGVFYVVILSRNKTMSDLDGPWLSYDLGGKWENWCMFLGENPIFWPLPVNTMRGDGYRFKCRQIKS